MITTKPFQAGYAWRDGTRLHHADATLVGHQIDALGDEQPQREDIVKAGVVELGGHGELTKCFTQDRDAAAHKCWEDEADYLMRCLVPLMVNPQTEDEYIVPQRVWVPLYSQTNAPGDAGVYQRATTEFWSAPDVALTEASDVDMSLVTPLAIVEDVRPGPPQKRERMDKQMRGWVALMEWRDAYGDDPLYAPVIAAIDKLAA